MRRAHLSCLAVAGIALCAPASAVAQPAAEPQGRAAATVRLLSVSSPPSTAGPRESFSITGRVRNATAIAARPRLTVTLRRSKTTTRFRKVRAQRLVKVGSGDTLRYRSRIKLPADIAPGRYF